jgi:hypothetical protein
MYRKRITAQLTEALNLMRFTSREKMCKTRASDRGSFKALQFFQKYLLI